MKFEHTKVFNFDGAFRGLRNPLESWEKSDSGDCMMCGSQCFIPCEYPFRIGKNDMNLAQRMLKAGTDNSKFMRQIMVSVDITAPLYWWKEFDTYKVGTVANSTSTMHKLASTPITKECFEFDSVIEYFDDTDIGVQDAICNLLENYRLEYLRTKDKRVWKALIQLLPNGWLQTRTITLNYEVLRNMYFARKSHKLDEWSVNFVAWIEQLPYAKELICYDGKTVIE